MEGHLYLAFTLASMVLIIVPGPNVLVVVSTSITHGTARGLQTVLGTSTAMVIQLLITALGTSWVVATIASGFDWLRWLGVVYLIVLGLLYLFRSWRSEQPDDAPITAAGTFGRGFIVSLTNPKTILFFSAFLPQFVSIHGSYMNQIFILSATFVLLATCLDSLYAIAAGRVSTFIQGLQLPKMQKGLTGLLYLTAGVWLATLRKN